MGGPRACPDPWPRWPVWGDEERQALNEVLESGQWWFGEKVRRFESEFAAFQGARYAVTCTNGTTAIEMALRALGIGEGDEVIVPAYTFIATASAVVTVGAIPVFADIDPRNLCIDPADVERKISPRTKAIIPVHVGGCIADMDRLNSIAKAYNLRVLEDAAHAWGSELDGRGAGVLSECGTFSFQVSKNITAGEGGALVTDNEELAELCRSYTHCGRRRGGAWYDHDYLGSNLRLTEFQAAILLAQLRRLPDQMNRRQQNAALLNEKLGGMGGIRLLDPEPRMTRRSYHMYIFRVNEAVLGVSRDRFIEALSAEGVPVSRGWYRPLYKNAVFQNTGRLPAHPIIAPLSGKGVRYFDVQCPVCEQVCNDAVWIPQNVLLADEPAIEKLATAIDKVISGVGELQSTCPGVGG
ncbi:MAG: DegT/DnrJ/EryC1/StrS family aminotransferase [Verrucomicrobiae bacterium]|nr:DegT/DnrJ/EryC1/StrS family aminotransferase [Verrucomicrobiae bacterium]